MRLFVFIFFFLCTLPGFAQDGSYSDALFNQKLRLSRDVLTRPSAKKLISEILEEELMYIDNDVTKLLKIPPKKSISETQLLILMDQNPDLLDDLEKFVKEVPRDSKDTRAILLKKEKWSEKFTKILSNETLKENFRKQNNPLEPYAISDKQGYSQVKTYINHSRIVDNKVIAGENLKQVWVNEIKSAKKEIALNVYDFDLEEIADELINAKKRGVEVKVGIDGSVIEARPEVQKIFKKLKANGIFVHAVDSVGLNHQKMMAIDWTVESAGKVLFSSGNLTQSCLGPEGDLLKISKLERSRFSIPNANHVITMKSDITSSIIYHEISKTIDPGFQLRGQDYPLGGIYKIWGGPKTLGSKRPYISLAFSPNGALDAVNKNFISQAILRSKGEVKMVQFAFSSGTINEALLKRAENEIAKKGKFVFQSVGDTPFAMQDWSVFLKMSGIDLIRSKSKSVPVKYVEIKNSEWKKLMGQEGLNELRQQIRVAPEVYGTHQVDINGIKSQVTSKIHHKVLITGENQSRIAITGSFNFSAGAENNQEFILLIKDERITKELNGAIDYLHQESRGSVFEEALARNKSRNFESAIKPDEAVKGIRPSLLNLKKAPVPCNSLGSQLKFLETLR